MSRTVFGELLSFVSPVIVKKSTAMRGPISPSEKLAVTLWYLVTRDAQCSIAASCRISSSPIIRMIRKTCDAIWASLKERIILIVHQTLVNGKVLLKHLKVN